MYQSISEIDFSVIVNKWRDVVLFDDVFLNMQGMNIGITDPLITENEYALLNEYIEIERTPIESCLLVASLSQMWVFSLYELLRLWREQIYNIKKWFSSGSINQIIKNIDDNDKTNVALYYRKGHLEEYRDSQEFRELVEHQSEIIKPFFKNIELFRINLAKHTTPGKNNMIPRAPGYGRINMLCGAMDYELLLKDGSYTIMNRRDIADELRNIFEVI